MCAHAHAQAHTHTHTRHEIINKMLLLSALHTRTPAVNIIIAREPPLCSPQRPYFSADAE